MARALAAVPEHPLLDRLVRGRFWIGFVAFALLGIVGLQLSLLKLNTGIGRAIEHQGLLERQNATLRAEVSSLSSGDRVESQAIRTGMVVAPPGAIRFLAAGGHAAALRAARQMTAPTPTSSATTGPAATDSGTAAAATATTATATTVPTGTTAATTTGTTAATTTGTTAATTTGTTAATTTGTTAATGTATAGTTSADTPAGTAGG